MSLQNYPPAKLWEYNHTILDVTLFDCGRQRPGRGLVDCSSISDIEMGHEVSFQSRVMLASTPLSTHSMFKVILKVKCLHKMLKNYMKEWNKSGQASHEVITPSGYIGCRSTWGWRVGVWTPPKRCQLGPRVADTAGSAAQTLELSHAWDPLPALPGTFAGPSSDLESVLFLTTSYCHQCKTIENDTPDSANSALPHIKHKSKPWINMWPMLHKISPNDWVCT